MWTLVFILLSPLYSKQLSITTKVLRYVFGLKSFQFSLALIHQEVAKQFSLALYVDYGLYFTNYTHCVDTQLLRCSFLLLMKAFLASSTQGCASTTGTLTQAFPLFYVPIPNLLLCQFCLVPSLAQLLVEDKLFCLLGYVKRVAMYVMYNVCIAYRIPLFCEKWRKNFGELLNGKENHRNSPIIFEMTNHTYKR